MIRWLTVCSVVMAGMFPHAAISEDGLALLQQIAQGSRQVNYSGTFVYRSGDKVETSRISRGRIDGRDLERIEVLDGSPRELIREGGEVKCFLPEEKLLIIESRPRHRGFPALLPSGLGSLADHYVIRSGKTARMAGLESRSVMLEPRDNLRYRHELWMDNASGLLLKASLLSESGEVLESFAFTQVKIGVEPDLETLKPRYDRERVRVQQVKATEVKMEELGWVFRTVVPGFRKVSALRREAQDSRSESYHVLFSDGLASISVFIEPGTSADKGETAARYGPVNVVRRQLPDHRLVVMGEVPVAAVKRMAEGIERKKK